MQFFQILIIIISTFLTAVSQIILKYAALKFNKHSFTRQYLNPYVIFAYSIFFGVIFLNIYFYTFSQLKLGVLLNTAPIIFVLLLSKVFLKEKITKFQLIGSIIIIIGMAIFSL